VRRLGLAEIMFEAAAAANHRERVEVLRKNDSTALRRVFKLMYDGEWDLPEGWKPVYTPSIYLDQEDALFQSMRMMDKFLVNGYPGLTQEKKQLLFVQLLEKCDKEDALLLIGMKNGKLPWKGLGPATVREAFPGLLNEKAEPEVGADI
jgi:hypothetical protein